MQTREQIQRDIQNQIQRDVQNAVQEARQAARDAAQISSGRPSFDEAIRVLRAEIEGTKAEIAELTRQLTPDLSNAREAVITSQIESAQERLASLQGRFDQLVSGTPRAATTRPPVLPGDVVPPEAVTISIWFFATAAVTIISIPIIRAWARWLDRRGHTPPASPDVAPRLDRIEQAIEAVAIEVERVSEGQRFANKLMSELRALPAVAQAPWSAAQPAREPALVRREEG